MSVVDDPGHGAIKAEIGGVELTLRLRLGEIERWEDKHPRGFYAFFQAMLKMDASEDAPKLREVRDLLALAIVGGGKTEAEAKEVMGREGPEAMIRHRTLAQGLLMATLIPAKEDRDMLGEEDGGDEKKSRVDSESEN